MDTTVDVTIPVDARAATELRDDRTRDAIGRLVSRVLQRQRQENVERLFAAIERLGADAEAKGLTDDILAEELAAYNAERRH
jgi:hypothetical protein